VNIIQSKLIRILLIVNLSTLAVILLRKIQILNRITGTVSRAFLIPLVISVLIFYMVRPLNSIFLKKNISSGKASMLTICIFTFILGGFLTYFSRYAYEEFMQISRQLWVVINNKKQMDGYLNFINSLININQIYDLLINMVKNYLQQIGNSFIRIGSYFMNAFSTAFLIIVIVFYLLKDGHKFKKRVIYFIPEKYKIIADSILSESDNILSHYVTGQAKVALSLAVMIYLGYKIINMPNALLLATITFILAFIPFVGFFISMIIPIVIALSMGLYMFLKLLIVFIIVQTLKGRVVVPAIMAKSMNIHPLTDIFLVIMAIAVGGPFVAFSIVPIYAILKNIVITVRNQ